MKTATTTLQLRVFSQHEELYYLGGPKYRHEAIHNSIAAISKQDRLHYDHVYHKDKIRNAITEARKQSKPILLSAESLTTPTVDRMTKAERLVGLFGDIRVVLCLRRPVDLLISLYGEAIKQLNPRTDRLPSLDHWLDEQWSEQRATRPTRFLDFVRLIRCYQNLVGVENVCVLLFEDLCNEPAEYARKLSAFIGVNPKRTLELLQAQNENRRISQLDYLLFKLATPLGYLGGKDRLREFIPPSIRKIVKKSLSATKQLPMSDEWEDRIRGYSREENRDLCKLIGSGPERYDYF